MVVLGLVLVVVLELAVAGVELHRLFPFELESRGRFDCPLLESRVRLR